MTPGHSEEAPPGPESRAHCRPAQPPPRAGETSRTLLAGFTEMTEKFSTAMYMDRGAEQLVELLNHYMSAIVESECPGPAAAAVRARSLCEGSHGFAPFVVPMGCI